MIDIARSHFCFDQILMIHNMDFVDPKTRIGLLRMMHQGDEMNPSYQRMAF